MVVNSNPKPKNTTINFCYTNNIRTETQMSVNQYVKI